MSGISIITPYYCGEKYLSGLQRMVNNNVECLRNNKMDLPVQFIVVNDSPWEEIEEKPIYSSFEYTIVRYPENKGIHGARVAGLKKAKGDYILFLDQDDEITDNCLFHHFLNIGVADVDVGNAWIEQSDSKKTLLYNNSFQFKKISMLSVYAKSHNQIVSPGQCLIKAASIPDEWKKFQIQKNGSDDLMLWIIMLSRNAKFSIEKEPLYIHKYTGINLSQDSLKIGQSSIEACDYLSLIEGINEAVIEDIRKSRTFDTLWNNTRGIYKAVLLIKNADGIIVRAIWKLKSMICINELGRSVHATQGGLLMNSTGDQLKKLHETLIEILDYIVSICEANNIEYYLVGGSALGAYRHHGFIPWDDDLDIAMPRIDYEKFIEIMSTQSSKYYVQNQDNEPRYFLSFSKVRKEGTVFVEQYTEGIYQNNGVFVDVFPIDAIGEPQSRLFKVRYWLVRYLTHILKFNSCRSLFKKKEKKIVFFLDWLISCPSLIFSGKKILCLIDKLRRNSDNAAAYWCVYNDGRILKRDIYYPPRKMKFGDRVYNVPNKIEAYLEVCYGEDYMQLPPENKRVTHLPVNIML